MNTKYLAFRLACLCFSILLALYVFGMGKGLFDWAVWRIDGGHPLVVDGRVDRIYELKGRDRGSQYLWVEQGQSHKERFDSVLDIKEVRRLVRVQEGVRVHFYPTATGKRYIFNIVGLDTGMSYHKGGFTGNIGKDWQLLF